MIKNTKNIWLCISLLLIAKINMYSQQRPQYTQYMYNTMSINPAYAGSREILSVLGVYRTQWVGLDGAPKTMNINLDTPVGRGVGLGLSIINDKIGPSNTSNFNADLSYNIPLSDYYKIYFGLKVSGNLINVDFRKLNIYDPEDPQFQSGIENKFSPNIGAGVYLKSDNMYLGISSPYMLETKYYNRSQVSLASERTHFYVMGGYVFDLTYNLKFKPAFTSEIVNGAPFQLDVSANFLYNEKLTLGINYRLSAAVSTIVGFQVSNGLFVGYSYDTDATKLGNYNSGSHEIMLRFDMFDKSIRAKSPRFF